MNEKYLILRNDYTSRGAKLLGRTSIESEYTILAEGDLFDLREMRKKLTEADK